MLITVQSKTLPLIQVNDYADNILAQQISQISGVGLVRIGGAQKPSVRVQVDPTKLAALGMSLEDIRGVIATVSVNQPKGTIDGPSQSFTVYTNDQLLKAEPWNDVMLAYRNGAPIRVRDIGACRRRAGEQQGRRLGLSRRGRARHRNRARGAASSS